MRLCCFQSMESSEIESVSQIKHCYWLESRLVILHFFSWASVLVVVIDAAHGRGSGSGSNVSGVQQKFVSVFQSKTFSQSTHRPHAASCEQNSQQIYFQGTFNAVCSVLLDYMQHYCSKVSQFFLNYYFYLAWTHHFPKSDRKDIKNICCSFELSILQRTLDKRCIKFYQTYNQLFFFIIIKHQIIILE